MAEFKVGERVTIEGEVTEIQEAFGQTLGVTLPSGVRQWCRASDVKPEPVTTLHAASCGHGVNYRCVVTLEDGTELCLGCAAREIDKARSGILYHETRLILAEDTPEDAHHG